MNHRDDRRPASDSPRRASRRTAGALRLRHRLSLALLVLAGLPACGGGDEPKPPTASTLSVALLLAGPENDEGWNQSAWEGLTAIEQQLGARVRKVRASSASQIQQALTEAARQGFSLVYGHGVEFNQPALKIAAEWPAVRFATSGGDQSAPNLAAIVFRSEEGAYELGILAAHLTKSKVLSSLHGEAFEAVKRTAAAFARGARSVVPDMKILEEYLGSWEDAPLAKERALAHAAQGADVYFQNADAAGAGVFEACRARGGLAFGCNRDQTGKAPDVIVASAVSDIPGVLVALAEEVRDGRFTGGARSFGLKEGKVRVAFNPALADRVPPAARTAMEAAGKAMITGELKPTVD